MVFIKKIIIVLLFAIALVLPSYANRPFVVDDASVVGKNKFSCEVSLDRFNWQDGDTTNSFLFVPIYGVTSKLELALEIPYWHHHQLIGNEANGLSDTNIRLKYLLNEETSKSPAYLVKFFAKSAIGDYTNDLGTGDWNYNFIGVATKNFGKLRIDANLGYVFVGKAQNPSLNNTFFYGIALSYKLTDKFGLCAEAFCGTYDDIIFKMGNGAGTFGCTYKISDRVTLDGGINYKVKESLVPNGGTLGATILF